jgi:hypothetical protein
VVHNFGFLEVNYGELLKMGSFFLFHTNLGVAKLQVLGNKICQTVRDALMLCADGNKETETRSQGRTLLIYPEQDTMHATNEI